MTREDVYRLVAGLFLGTAIVGLVTLIAALAIGFWAFRWMDGH